MTSHIERDRIAIEEIGDLGWDVEAVDWWLADGPFEAARRLAGREVARDSDVEAELVPLRSRLSPLDQERLVELGSRAIRAVDDVLAGAAIGGAVGWLVPELHRPGRSASASVRAPSSLIS